MKTIRKWIFAPNQRADEQLKDPCFMPVTAVSGLAEITARKATLVDFVLTQPKSTAALYAACALLVGCTSSAAPSLVIACPGDLRWTARSVPVPSPDPSSVMILSNGCGNVVVSHLADYEVLDRCTNTIFRAYQAIDSCNQLVVCTQRIDALLPRILGFSTTQSLQTGGVVVVYCANVLGSDVEYTWDIPPNGGYPISWYQEPSNNCFYVTYSPTDENLNTVTLIVRSPPCSTAMGTGTSPPVGTCGICLSRGLPTVLTSTNGSGAGPEVTAGNCGTIGATAKWFKMVATNDTGSVTISTEGSSNRPVLAVFSGPRTNLSYVRCDTTSGGHSSRVTFNATNGTVYWIVVDGLSNSPNLRLASGFEPRLTNYSIVQSNGWFEMRSTIAPPITYQLQAATSVVAAGSNWTTLLTTNLGTNYPYVYIRDTNAANFRQRFYRLVAP